MANPFVLACPVWRFVHTRFQISSKEFVIISMKDISVQLELKYIQAQNLKIKRSRFCGDHVLFGSHSDDWMFGFLVVAIIFLLFRWLAPFLFTVFMETFLLDFKCSFYFSPQSLFDVVLLGLQNFPRIQWAIYVAGARGVRGLCFIGRRHDSVDRRFDEVW